MVGDALDMLDKDVEHEDNINNDNDADVHLGGGAEKVSP